MADGVAITAGSGTTIATDDTGASGHVQIVKLAISTDGSVTLIPADATNGVDVDVTRLPAFGTGQAVYAEDVSHNTGDNGVPVLAVRTATPTDRVSADGDYGNLQLDQIGRLRTTSAIETRTAVTPTISSGVAYASGDVVGAALTFTGAAAFNGGSGRITNAILTDRSTQAAPLELWIFQASPTLVGADNAAFDITDANLETAVPLGVIQFVNYFSTASGRVSQGTVNGMALGAAPLHYICGASATSIYGALAVRGTPTYGSTADLVVSLVLEQE